MRTKALKVGEVARRTGITIRALHHYDEIGLLKPSKQTEAGHRLYTEDDIAVLQRIVSLRQLSFCRYTARGPNANSEAERAWKQLAAEVRAEFDRARALASLPQR